MGGTRRGYRMLGRADDVQQTRDRILLSARSRFVALPYDEVRLADIAGDAGVSHQTLHNHFASKDKLFTAVTTVLGAEAERLRGMPPPGDVAAAVRGLVRMYERFGDANVRIVAIEERVSAVADAVAVGRAAHSAWLEATFGADLPTDTRLRRRTLAALYAATDVGTWKLLRRDLGRSRGETTAVMEQLVRAALAASAPS